MIDFPGGGGEGGGGFLCNKQIGFLFPHRCGRLTSVGCTDCQEGRLADDPYDRAGNHEDYDNYGEYDTGWGSDDYDASAGALADFTEADGEALERENEDFEKELGES
ncbi:MAG: hypothetical protein ABIZ80_02835 [Bryobacteraceae bacterium]